MRYLAALALAALLMGCGTTPVVREPPKPREPETLMLENFDPSWRAPCQLLEPETVTGEKGDLLIEYIVIAGLLNKCSARYEILIDYLTPYIDRLRTRETK